MDQTPLIRAWNKLDKEGQAKAEPLYQLVAQEGSTLENEMSQHAASSMNGAMDTVRGMIKAKEEILCNLCKGWGHQPKACATLKSMNKATKDTPSLRAAWGSIKSSYLSSVATELTLEAAKGRKKRQLKWNSKQAKFDEKFVK